MKVVSGQLNLVRRRVRQHDSVLRSFFKAVFPLNVVYKVLVLRVVRPVVTEFTDENSLDLFGQEVINDTPTLLGTRWLNGNPF